MPGLVKIGRTDSDDPATRVAQLYSTGVPVPFDLVYAGRVADSGRVEQVLHNAFRDRRVNPKREFFEIEPDQAMKILELLDPVDVTGEAAADFDQSVGSDEKAAAKRLTTRRPPLNFDEMGIPIGAELLYAADPNVSVTVAEPRKVSFSDDVVALSFATKMLLGIDYYVAPTRHWTYEGRSLNEIYEDTYPRGEQ